MFRLWNTIIQKKGGEVLLLSNYSGEKVKPAKKGKKSLMKDNFPG